MEHDVGASHNLVEGPFLEQVCKGNNNPYHTRADDATGALAMITLLH